MRAEDETGRQWMQRGRRPKSRGPSHGKARQGKAGQGRSPSIPPASAAGQPLPQSRVRQINHAQQQQPSRRSGSSGVGADSSSSAPLAPRCSNGAKARAAAAGGGGGVRGGERLPLRRGASQSRAEARQAAQVFSCSSSHLLPVPAHTPPRSAKRPLAPFPGSLRRALKRARPSPPTLGA